MSMVYAMNMAFYQSPAEVTFALFMVTFITTVVCFSCLVEWIVMTLARWKMYEKAGEPSWKALIPFYNNYTEVKFAWNKTWAIVYISAMGATILFSGLDAIDGGSFMHIPVCMVSIFLVVIHIIFCVKLSKAFGHKGGWAVGLILVREIFYLMIGLGKSQYTKPEEPAAPAAPAPAADEAPKA